MGLGGVNQLHQAGLGLVDEVLFLQHNAEGVANIEEDRFDIGGHGNSSFNMRGLRGFPEAAPGAPEPSPARS